MFVIIPDILTADEIASLKATLREEDFLDGRATASGRAREVKRNLQTDRKSERMAEAQRVILGALARNSTFQAAAAPKRIVPPRFNLYRSGMYYGNHVDNALMGEDPDRVRVDMSFTLFMNEPSEYDGGELAITTTAGTHSYKLPAGHIILYPTYFFHEVKPVTRGERLACVSWLQTMLRDPLRREIIFDLAMVSSMVESRNPAAIKPALDILDKARKNLLRQWLEN